jgi:hypothetical protein
MIVTATCINDRLLSLHLGIEDLGDVQEYYEIFN